MLTIHELVTSAIEDFKDRLAEVGESEECPYDLIHEIVDGHIPIYYSKVLEVAKSCLQLVTTEPELGPAYGTNTPVHLIMSNIYEYLSEELNNWYAEYKTEK